MGQKKLHSLLFLWLSLGAEQSCPSLVSGSLVTPPKDMYIALGHLSSPLGSLWALWMCQGESSCSCVPASNHRVRTECSNVLPEPGWVMSVRGLHCHCVPRRAAHKGVNCRLKLSQLL